MTSLVNFLLIHRKYECQYNNIKFMNNYTVANLFVNDTDCIT